MSAIIYFHDYFVYVTKTFLRGPFKSTYTDHRVSDHYFSAEYG